MLTNGFDLSINNPIALYAAFAVNGLLMLLVLWYVRTKFRRAHVALKTLRTEWDSAESKFSSFAGMAQQQLSRLSSSISVHSMADRSATINRDTRNQAVAMAKRGFSVPDISRSCGVSEGEVEVLLGMARMQK